MQCTEVKTHIAKSSMSQIAKHPKRDLLAAEYLVLIMYNYPTAKTSALYESTDGAAGWPSDNPANSEGLEDSHRTVPELTVWVYWQPWPPIWQRLRSDPDPDPKWWSGTVANTRPGRAEWQKQQNRPPREMLCTGHLRWTVWCFNIDQGEE